MAFGTKVALIGVVIGVVVLPERSFAQLMNNASCRGVWHFRYLGVTPTPNSSALHYTGTLTFDGRSDANGNGSVAIVTENIVSIAPIANNCVVFTNGLMQMRNPFDPTRQNNFVGELTEEALLAGSFAQGSTIRDMLVAVPVSTNNSASTLNGKYWVVSIDVSGGDTNRARSSFFSVTADGKGHLDATVPVTRYAGPFGVARHIHKTTVPTYRVSPNGAGTLDFSRPAGLAQEDSLPSGEKRLFVAPDGNFFIAGGALSADIIVGVKAVSRRESDIDGLYFAGAFGARHDTQQAVFEAESGSSRFVGAAHMEIGHRIVADSAGGDHNHTYSLPFLRDANGLVYGSDITYAVGAGGRVIIGASTDRARHRITICVKAPTLSGPGVFLNPHGVLNAASNTPITAPVSPGEVLLLSGSGMANQMEAAAALPLPSSLGGVEVVITWFDRGARLSTTAPLYHVSPTEIRAIVPYEVPGDGRVIIFQVRNNARLSNPAYLYSDRTSPGVFTISFSGLGSGLIIHTDSRIVSETNPARAGETVAMFLNGMGDVAPASPAGSAGPVRPLSLAKPPSVSIGGIQALVSFAGLAPGMAGVYQINVIIPSGIASGPAVGIELTTLDDAGKPLAITSTATIAVAN